VQADLIACGTAALREFAPGNTDEERLNYVLSLGPLHAGVTLGAAYSFALRAGVRPGQSFKHAFWCGHAPSAEDIAVSLETTSEIDFRTLGNINDPKQRARVADLMARIVAEDGVLDLSRRGDVAAVEQALAGVTVDP
jgi:hypothetical protein